MKSTETFNMWTPVKQIYTIYPITSPDRKYRTVQKNKEDAISKWRKWWFKDKTIVPITVIIETDWVEQL